MKTPLGLQRRKNSEKKKLNVLLETFNLLENPLANQNPVRCLTV